MKRRILSIITALALCLSLCPTWALAAEADPALCPHHREHTEECGYIAPSEGQPCGHEHTAECYALEVLPDTESGDDYEIGADTENLLDCQHVHDSECGYVQADPGAPCGYVCHICPIEALIAALPEQVTEDNADDVRGQLDHILDLYRELNEDEQEQIDLSRCYELQGALDGANDPAPITESVEYQEASWDGSQVTYESKTETCTLVENSAEAVTWTAGWYAVSGTVTISEPITVNGEVHLILADGCTLNAEKGIVVTTGNSLTIYAQSENGGTLNATGTTDDSGNASAGIGGSTTIFDSGSITIHGGIINATGGVANDNLGNPNYGGAGIGGGTTKSANGGSSGTITIYGGTVTANSGAGNATGAGIGGGAGNNVGGAGSNITIYGGNVTAEAHGTLLSGSGAGIGGGFGSNDGGAGSNIQIHGGTIKATGSSLGAGIGGGGSSPIDNSSHKSGDGAVTISGGTVTAIGGKYAAGIGGGGGYYSSYTWGGTTYGSGCTGGTGSVTITGGIVDAKGGAGNSSGDYAGAPIGNGGNTTATATVSKTNAIVFENGAGTVCGDVTLDGSYTVPGDYTLNIPLGASLSGSGTLSGGNAFTTENLTADMISVPTNLYYNGEDRTADITTELSGELDKGVAICGQTFTVSGWTLAVAKTDDLTYTATYTNNNDNTNTFTKTITLQKSGTDLTSEGKVQTYKGDTLTKDFTASDTITVKATPTATGAAPAKAAARLRGDPTAGQMAVFVGDTQVSAPADVGEDGAYTMTVSAADVLVAAGGPGTGITLTAKFVGNNNMADGAGTATVNITAVAVAEKDGKVIGYYGESNLDDAFTNDGATVTLLADVKRANTLTIKANCTLDLGGHNITFTGTENAWVQGSVTTMTIRGEGEIVSEQSYALVVSGSVTLEGGTFTSNGGNSAGVYVNSDVASLSVTGEYVTIRNTGGGYGLAVNYAQSVQLSAGTYKGEKAVSIVSGTTTLGDLLNQEGASRVAYYKDNTTLVTEGLDGQTLPGGSYTVKACTHIFGSSTTCPACGGEAVARVTIGGAVTHYGDLPSAWAAVQGKTADLYLLKSVDAAGVGRWGRLDLASGSVTLGMADGVVLSGSSNVVIRLTGGELTLNSGTIRNNGTTGNPPGLQVVGGTLRISGGTVEANWAVYINGGHAEITGGTFTATGNYSVGLRKDEGTVKINGGQFSGSQYAVYNRDVTLADLLAEDYAFKQGGAWVTDTSGDSLTGTVTAEPAPVKITAQPTGGEVTYGTDASLSVTAAAVDESQTITYQWYQAGENSNTEIAGATAASYTVSSLGAGTYSFYCTVTCDSYTVKSETVTVTVKPRQLTPTITGTATKTYDGTTGVASGQLSITLTGVLEGDTVTATASYAYDNANAGEGKTIIASGITLEGDSKDNYTLSSTTATTTGTITKSQPTIAFAGGYDPSKTYDGQTISNPTADDLTITGAAFGNVDFTWSATPKDAGTYTLTANIKETPNTAAASTSPLTVTINRATLTATGATVASKPYDTNDTATVTGVTFTGLVNGETLALGTDYTASGEFDSENAGTGKSVTVTVTLTSDKAKNYSLAQNTTTATSDITKASSTITTAPTASGITYGQALSDSALTDGEAVSGDTTLTGAWNWTAPATKPNAGTAQYEVTFTPSDTNYDTATVNVSVTVAKATPTLTAPTAAAIQYGQKLSDSTLTGGTATNPNGSAAVAGSWSWASGNTRPTATGTFPVAFVPGDTANYNTPGNVDASVTVNPAAPKITLTVPAYQIAGGEVKVTYQVENPHDAAFKEGIPETVTLTYKVGDGAEQTLTGTSFNIPAETAKNTVITVTASTAAVDGKYTAATKTATVTVTDKIPVEINGISVAGRVYNGQPVSYTGTLTVKKLDGTVVTDAPITYTWSSGVAPVNAGDYSLVIAVGGDKYIGSTTVDFTIGKASVTITAASKSAVVGSTKPELTYTVAGLANGDTLATVPTLTCDADMNTVGSYPITASGAAVPNTSNYNPEITYVAGTLTVTAKPSNNGGGNNYTPSTPSSPTVTVPVSGDKSTVHVSASVSGTTATVSKIDTSQIENVIGDNGQASMVEIDFTGLGKTIDTVKLPAAAIKDIAAKAQNKEVGGLTVKLPEAEISFDANALSAIQAQAGSQITLTLTPAKPADLNNRQKEAAGSAPVFDLTLRSSSGAITDFRGGYATVSLPYTLAAGQNPSGVVVYYLDSTGNITPCTTMYDVRSKSAIFTTGHLSLYFVGYDPAAAWVSPFSDVAEGAWYYDAVRYASENGLMGGYGNGKFGPNDNLSRAQFAQILFNKEGRPVVNYLLQYGDVATGAWYTEAVRWATSQGIVGGYGNGMFGPNDNITREQLAVMLWRYAGSPAATEKELHFTDADKASGYALEALRWAVENGIINGYGNGQLAPQGLATRAQVAQMLKNFLGK